MPLELQIIRASEFIRLGASGQIDLAASRAMLRGLAGACRRRGIDRALLDLRAVRPGLEPVFSPADLAALVNTFREIGFTHQQRLAVLYTSDPHHRTRLFAFIAKLRGWSVKASNNFEETLLWLSKGQRTEDQMEAGAQKIPVHLRKAANDRKNSKVPSAARRRPTAAVAAQIPIRHTAKAERRPTDN
jgi:hypothetical protein